MGKESSESEAEESDVQVIDDEDRELAAQIEAERKAKRAAKLKEKREQEGRTPKKQPAKKTPAKKRRAPDTDDDSDGNAKKKKSAKKQAAKKKKPASSEDNDESEDDKKRKKGKSLKKKKREETSDEAESSDEVKKKKRKKKTQESTDEDSDSEDDQKNKKKKRKKEEVQKKKKKRADSSKESDSDDEEEKPKKKVQKKKVKKPASSEESDSEDEKEEKPKKKKVQKNKKKRADSSDETEESEDDVKTKKSKKAKSESSDNEESDDETAKPSVKKSVNKKMKKADSSGEEEEDSDSDNKKKNGAKTAARSSSRSVSSEKVDGAEKKKKRIESSEPKSSDEEIIKKSTKKKAPVVRLSSGDESEDEVMPKKKNRSVAKISDDSAKPSEEEEEESSGDDDSDARPSKSKKKNNNSGESSDDSLILPSKQAKRGRKSKPVEKKKKKKGMVMDDDELAKETIDAEKAEKERRKRLEQKQKEFNGIVLEEGEDLTEVLTGQSSQRKLKSVVLDPDTSGDPPVPVAVHDSLVRILKPHQAHGIQFMYDCAIESTDRLETEGSGGILAHCMGLGKTLQVITFLHTIMMHEKTGAKIKKVLVVVPKNVIINWFKEFRKWLADNDEDLDQIEVEEMDSCKTVEDRRRALKTWHSSTNPTVMIIGYDLFRILTAEDDPKKKKSKAARKLAKAKEEFRYYLQNPGPDMVVCDEAHKLKNDDSALSKTMVKILTKRRICLTGTPLQNNLMEYHCMVNFVKPGLLGTKSEFANRFVNIINRGRTRDASVLEVSFMKRRCHVLYEHLKKCVDRKDYRVLTEAIPPKQEYVINVRLTDRQCALYKAFLVDVVGTQGLSKRLLPDYHMFSRIWTHPYQLIVHEKRLERERIMREDAEEEADFIDDDESDSEESIAYSSESDQSSDDEGSKKKKKKGKATKKSEAPKRRSESDEEEDTAMTILQNGIRQSKRLAGDEPDIRDTETPPEYTGWFAKSGLVSEEDRDDFSLSYKLVLLMEIIKKCEEIGDKLLIFSQSLESLAMIRRMLEFMAGTGQWFADGHEALNAEGETWSWLEGEDYMTIDGSVQSLKRDAVQTTFNDPENFRARLMLISTKAGSLGTNMVAANRVIIFDACWNPSHDTQSLFRVYRFGQTKPVYIYRFIAQGTMEERIYKRQVTKESTSMRVVDEAQIQRHYIANDLTELYQFTPADPEIEIAYAPPKDRLLADVLLKNHHAVVDYIEHDTLFANQEEEKLSEQEMKDAWADYENDKTGVGYRSGVAPGNPILMNSQVQMMLNNRLQQNVRLDQLQSDVLFRELQKMRNKDISISVKIVLLRNLLEQLLPFIPIEMRGGMSEFNTHFVRLVHETERKNERPEDLLKKSLESFRTVIRMVREIPTCKEPIVRMQKSYPYLFIEESKKP